MYVSREMQIKTMKYHNQTLEHWQHEMLAKKWNNRNSHTLLMGMKNDIAFLENSLAVSYKSKHTLNIQSRNYALRYLTKRVDYLCSCKNPHTDVSVSSVQFSCSVVSDSANPWIAARQAPCLSQTPGVHSTHIHWVGDAIQPSHPLSSPSPPAPNLSQHQSLFQWVNSSHEVAKVLEFQL